MTSIQLLRRLREHQVWANHRLMDAASRLTVDQLNRQFPIGQGSVLATLVHLYAAEFVWLEAINGNPRPISPFEVRMETLAELQSAWSSLETRWQAFYETLKESDLTRMIAKTSALDPTAPPRTTPLADILLHLSLYAQYTTAQMINMLRHLGVKPLPDPMMITLSRQQSA